MDYFNKSLFCFFVLFFSFSSLSASACKDRSDTLGGLELKGRILKTAGMPGNLCKVEVFLKGKVIDSCLVPENRVFTLRLNRGNMYTLRITKRDHVSKLIAVNTEFPEDIVDVMQFSFKTDLLSKEAAKELNQDALDFPAAIVHFEHKHEMFVFNETYTNELKQEIYSDPSTKSKMASSGQRK